MTRSGSATRPSTRGDESRAALLEAAIGVLREDGFAAATARNIAARAGCNQALVFYHYGSVVNLLLAALDDVSAQRRERYESQLAAADGIEDLVSLAATVFVEDLDSGDAALLVAMIAGAASTPGLGAEVKRRVEPWTEFAATALEMALKDSPLAQLLSAADAAHAVVALYLGLELLADLDGDRSDAIHLFQKAKGLAPLLSLLTATGPGPGAPTSAATPTAAARPGRKPRR